MSQFLKMLSYKKGDGNTHFPVSGEICLVSPPNCDNDDGYIYSEMECLWVDDMFAIFRPKSCWPNVYKWEHIRCKPLTQPATGDNQHG